MGLPASAVSSRVSEIRDISHWHCTVSLGGSEVVVPTELGSTVVKCGFPMLCEQSSKALREVD